MYQTQTHLRHLLSPAAYYDEAYYADELVNVLKPAWHFVGTTVELSHPGSFITTCLWGHAIQVRNFAGSLHALSNVCAHRHCLITEKSSGSAPTMRCPYHGWEYGPDGRTRRVPQPKNFTNFDREQHRLETYRVDSCGQLLFVCLDPDAPDLRAFLGDLYGLVAERFGEDWALSLNWNPQFSVNWKIPVENTLESYHVPSVHAHTFESDPGDERSDHILQPKYTAFQTKLPFSKESRTARWFQAVERSAVRTVGVQPTDDYWQYHLFPNLLFSFTDAISLVHCVVPTGACSSQGIARQFGRVGTRAGPRRWLARGWARIKASITKRILLEDVGLYDKIQAGLMMSQQAGILGRCEERIFHFQQFLQSRSEKVEKDLQDREGEAPADP